MRARSLKLLLPVALALIPMVDSGMQCEGQQLTPPLSPTAPQSLQECSQFEAQWGAFVNQLQAAHQNCLDARAKDPNVPGSGSGPGSLCSRAGCQSLHNVWFSMQSQVPTKVAQCQSEVSRYQLAQQQQQAATRVAQQQAQSAAAAAAQVRNQANQEMLQRAKDLQMVRNANAQSYEQSSAALRAQAEQRAAQLKQQSIQQSQPTDSDAPAADATDTAPIAPAIANPSMNNAPIQPNVVNTNSLADTSPGATQGSYSVPAGADPAAALMQPTDTGSLPGTQPSPQPNPVASTAPSSQGPSNPTVQDYIKDGLSPEAAQAKVESNSLSAIVAGTKADLDSLTQQLMVDPSQQQYQAPNELSPAVTGSQASLDDLLLHAPDRVAQQEFTSSVLGSVSMVSTLITCLAEPFACPGEVAKDAMQDKAQEMLIKALWANMCLNPANKKTCAGTPAPQNYAPASPGDTDETMPPSTPNETLGQAPN